jgi:alpha-beta hydrolase superfamily lysophospholipase
MPDAILRTYTAHDGNNLALMDWPLANGVAPRGTVVIVHGLGEHAGRYERVAERLTSWGFAVRSYDQHGHGESAGLPGALPTDTHLLDDLADILDSTRRRMDPRQPLILLGHSLGGLVAARLVSLNLRKVEGLVLSSPALDAGMNPLQKLLVRVLPRIAPNLRVGNGLNAKYLSHQPEVVKAYLADPFVHDRISARLARFIAEAGPAVLACAPQWRLPTLLLYAGADKLVNPAGSRAFASAAPSDIVTTQCFESMYHEIFNEVGRDTVFARLQSWLDARF